MIRLYGGVKDGMKGQHMSVGGESGVVVIAGRKAHVSEGFQFFICAFQLFFHSLVAMSFRSGVQAKTGWG